MSNPADPAAAARTALNVAAEAADAAQQALNTYAFTPGNKRNTAEYRKLVKAAKLANQAQYEAAQAIPTFRF